VKARSAIKAMDVVYFIIFRRMLKVSFDESEHR